MTDISILQNADPMVWEALHRQYRTSPSGVDAGIAALFDSLDGHPAPNGPHAPSLAALETALTAAYRTHGHLVADLDPVGLANGPAHPDLDPKSYRARTGNGSTRAGADHQDQAVVEQLLARLRIAYGGTLAAEFMHLEDPVARSWIADRMEAPAETPDPARRRWILDHLMLAESFEHFLQSKFPGIKRFGLEGAETQIPLVERLFECAVEAGIEDVVIGPMHRGRTTFMATMMGKPLPAVLAEFTGRSPFPDEFEISADASYHMGYAGQRTVAGGRLRLSMPSHPSHVETVIPVALGKVRAKRDRLSPAMRGRVLGLMMHTDAGFAGQGIVAETLQLAGLPGYATGGSIHVIINNQVGFTTAPEDARTSHYCSDPAKAIQAPIFHVNGDDPEAVLRAAELAFGFWARFGRDVVIDLVCYRRRGHNELDEPRFTQPVMYDRIDEIPSVREAYAGRLAADRTVDPDEVATMAAAHLERFESGYAHYESYRPDAPDWLQGHWSALRAMSDDDIEDRVETGVVTHDLREIGAALARVPDDFALHPKLRAQLDERARSVGQGEAITWATAEALAFGSLLSEGTPVRLTGQDACRGTFSQRHAVLHDQATGQTHTPLAHLRDGQGAFTIHDSPLSEAAVLAFEYGYSLEDPLSLVLWEAQFGDFANAAQVVIDQYLAAGEEKWLRQSGLTLLLPHGLEGGGPEHSSARLERFLQLCAKNNLQILNCTTPANYFHALRRQIRSPFRKPLVLLTPKGLLRHRKAVSTLAEMSEGSTFWPVIEDTLSTPAGPVRRVVLMSGRIYYELIQAAADATAADIAFVRIEQLYPLPEKALLRALAKHPDAELVWCQEEPENMGAWRHMRPLIEDLDVRAIGAKARRIRYVGRPASPSPATGQPARHAAEQSRLIAEALA